MTHFCRSLKHLSLNSVFSTNHLHALLSTVLLHCVLARVILFSNTSPDCFLNQSVFSSVITLNHFSCSGTVPWGDCMFRTMETDFWSSRIKLDSFQIDEMRLLFFCLSCRASSRRNVFWVSQSHRT